MLTQSRELESGRKPRAKLVLTTVICYANDKTYNYMQATKQI